MRRYHAFVTDYDWTIAPHGQVAPSTRRALQRVRESGRNLLLVTGRPLDSLKAAFEPLDLFDLVVVENGAVLYRPEHDEYELLAAPPPSELRERLEEEGVPLDPGQVVVGTYEPHQDTCLEVIRELGLEHQVIFNKGAVMILPPGVNKAFGLGRALAELGLSPHNVVAIGDGENDHAFVDFCEFSAAVANAVPALRDRVDYVTENESGDGVIELIDMLLVDDLRQFQERLQRHDICLGEQEDGEPVTMHPFAPTVLVSGSPGSGKSTFATAFSERLDEAGYQFCIVDPEGDYQQLEQAVVLGGPESVPEVEEVIDLLQDPENNAVVSLFAIPLASRSDFFEELLVAINELRDEKGRPHWLIIDETHHIFPIQHPPAAEMLPQDLPGTMLITIHSDGLVRPILTMVDLMLVIGGRPEDTIAPFTELLQLDEPSLPDVVLNHGQALAWWLHPDGGTVVFEAITPETQHRRHRRQYAEGELPEDRSFYFKGPEGKLNLRAHNLMLFMQLGEGVDDETWDYHLRRGDYSHWFREELLDDELADAVAEIEQDDSLSPDESRAAVREEIEERYTAPE